MQFADLVEATNREAQSQALTRLRAGQLDMMNHSRVPLGNQLPRRHIKLPSQPELPAYLQNPDASVHHPSRSGKRREDMLERLTSYLNENGGRIGEGRQMPAGWRHKDPADHMGSIMNP